MTTVSTDKEDLLKSLPINSSRIAVGLLGISIIILAVTYQFNLYMLLEEFSVSLYSSSTCNTHSLLPDKEL